METLENVYQTGDLFPLTFDNTGTLEHKYQTDLPPFIFDSVEILKNKYHENSLPLILDSVETLKNEYHTELLPLIFEYKGKNYNGTAKPIRTGYNEEICFEMYVILNGEYLGSIYCGKNLIYTMKDITDQQFIDKIGDEIVLWYEYEIY